MKLHEILGMEMPKGFVPLTFRVIEKALDAGKTVHWDTPGRQGIITFRKEDNFKRHGKDSWPSYNYLQLNFPDGTSDWFELASEDDDVLHLHWDDDELYVTELPGKKWIF